MTAFATRVALGVVVAMAVPGIAFGGNPKLHPVEAVCIEYQLSGQMQKGTMIQCHRDHGYEQYQIQNVTIEVSGFKQSNEQHTITIGDTIYAIDLKTRSGTRIKNPMYERMAAALEGKSPGEMAGAFTTAMGLRPTGQTKKIAGRQCASHSSPALGELCLSEDGLLLEMSVMGNVTTAVSVSLGESGEAANYRLHETVPISEGPDLSKLQKLMSPPANN